MPAPTRPFFGKILRACKNHYIESQFSQQKLLKAEKLAVRHLDTSRILLIFTETIWVMSAISRIFNVLALKIPYPKVQSFHSCIR